VFQRLTRHAEVRTLSVELAEVDNLTPLVGAGFRDKEDARHVARVVCALPSSTRFDAGDLCRKEL
jgi:hypothetical protein